MSNLRKEAKLKFNTSHVWCIEKEPIFWYFKAIAGSSNGRTIASEAVYLGSNPSPAALDFLNIKWKILHGGRYKHVE